MKIFILSTGEWGFGFYSDFVIAANSESEARSVAKENSGREGREAWDSASIKEIGIYTGESVLPVVILCRFHDA